MIRTVCGSVLIMNVYVIWIQLFKTHVDYVERTKPATAENMYWYLFLL